MSQTNFLIGRGELLTEMISPPKRKPEKATAYTFREAVKRLVPQATRTAEAVDALPSVACPSDLAVVAWTLNPSYVAKSYFPGALLRELGLAQVGSRSRVMKPEKWTRKPKPHAVPTTELFVAGKRSRLRELREWIPDLPPDSLEAEEVARLEEMQAIDPESRLRLANASPKERFFEVGLHLLEGEENTIIGGFAEYAEELGFKIHEQYQFQPGGLWFVPVEGPRKRLLELARFSFMRVVRSVPRLRGIRPITRTAGVPLPCTLPVGPPTSTGIKVAILDGGLPTKHPLGSWVRAYRVLDPKAGDDAVGLEHGLAVTSAFLFGPIAPRGAASQPFAAPDHFRVLDSDSHKEDPLELYRTLGHVEEVLLSNEYEFVNLSLGPDLPIEDSEVHAWTSVIDDLLSDGNTFMTVAVGNNGDMDRASGNARVQVPSDCVNAMAVGAASTMDQSWQRAEYSAVGPGRLPGVVKPDVLAFGGDAEKYFHVLASEPSPRLVPQAGTSFAAPYVLRSAVGVRAILGDDLSPLAIKALLIHAAGRGKHEKTEVGWGKLPDDIAQVITCSDGVARIVYQGELKPGKYLRAAMPLPKEQLSGTVRVKATFCYASPVDPQDAGAYTQAGLEVVFRPNTHKLRKGSQQPPTRSGFFENHQYATEHELRSQSGKWETVLQGETRLRAASLKDPVFELHYVARSGGGPATVAPLIRYALIITVEAPKHANLFEQVLGAYSNTLIALRPQVQIAAPSVPVQTGPLRSRKR